MAITDVGDDVYDSAIFLEANSFGNADENPLQDIFSQLKYEAENNALIGEKNIVFNFGSAEITDAKSLVFLDSLANILAKSKVKKVEIIGHTDSVGTEKSNLTLSEKRANAVFNYLVAKGISAEKLRAIGKGEENLLSLEKQDLNRRVEFRFFLE